MTPPVVRRAGREDWPAVARLRRAWAEEQAGGSVDDAGFEEALERWFALEYDQRLTWLADIDDTAVGMLNLLVFTRMPKPGRLVSRWGYLANVYVDRAHRDSGTGRLLLDVAVEHARAEGFARLVLSPSEQSVPFYLRAGFAPATSLLVHDLR